MFPVPRTLPGTTTTSPSLVSCAILFRLRVRLALEGLRASFDNFNQIGASLLCEATWRIQGNFRTIKGLREHTHYIWV